VSRIHNGQCNILIVDDISKNIQVLGNILRQDGYSLSFATSGSQALDMVFADDYDLILLDVMMPEMDGFEVCRKIRELPDGQAIPIIFLTAKTDEEDIVKGFQAGGTDYVTKPFNSEELLARVHAHLELKRARDEIQLAYHELAERTNDLIVLNEELQNALREIKTLRGFLPICANCKKIRKKDAPYDRQDSWVDIESYVKDHTEAEFTHSICPECMRLLYPDFVRKP